MTVEDIGKILDPINKKKVEDFLVKKIKGDYGKALNNIKNNHILIINTPVEIIKEEFDEILKSTKTEKFLSNTILELLKKDLPPNLIEKFLDNTSTKSLVTLANIKKSQNTKSQKIVLEQKEIVCFSNEKLRELLKDKNLKVDSGKAIIKDISQNQRNTLLDISPENIEDFLEKIPIEFLNALMNEATEEMAQLTVKRISSQKKETAFKKFNRSNSSVDRAQYFICEVEEEEFDKIFEASKENNKFYDDQILILRDKKSRKYSCYTKKNFKHPLTLQDLLKMKAYPHNRILYGAPGTGKSFQLKEETNNENYFDKDKVERVTFYNGYSYGQFVGAYKPKPIFKDKKGFHYKDEEYRVTTRSEPFIIYKYIPGIFLNILIQALKNPKDNYCLIIEEINRARADSVFGDMFQLLDRDENGKSEYSVNCSSEMMSYIESCYIGKGITKKINDNGIYLPENLYLWATMNSADQGVFPLDTAFKRRWNLEYIGLDDNEERMNKYKIQLTHSKKVLWNRFRHEINNTLRKEYNITEDKLIAPFFVKNADFSNGVLDKKVFIEKVVMYLKEDVMRHLPINEIFDKEIEDDGLSALVKKYNDGNNIFCKAFRDDVL